MYSIYIVKYLKHLELQFSEENDEVINIYKAHFRTTAAFFFIKKKDKRENSGVSVMMWVTVVIFFMRWDYEMESLKIITLSVCSNLS